MPVRSGATEYLALVIGNDKYDERGAFPPLSNCVRDAKLIESTLKGMGFKVMAAHNASRSGMDAARVEFEAAITPDTVALFYYAGHAIEVDGKNYLMGTNARLAGRSTLSEDAMEADTFAETMLEKQAATSFLILDCCREAPPAEWRTRGVKKRGLAEVKVDGDIIIAYSAKPGQAALDGQGEHSPYTQALAQWLPQGLSSTDMFQNIRETVMDTTAKQQRTWESGSLSKRFVFPSGKGFKPAAVVSARTTDGAARRQDGTLARETPSAATDRLTASIVGPDIVIPPASEIGPPREYIILTGGPFVSATGKNQTSTRNPEWSNYVVASRTRFQQLQQQIGNDPNALFTWLVFTDGYRALSAQDFQDRVRYLEGVRDKFHLHMVPIKTGAQVIEYLNDGQNRSRIKIAGFEYFGYSNRAAFIFEYTGNGDGSSKSFLYESQANSLRRNLFMRNAFVKSWGDRTGESMSEKWKNATGTPMIGAIGLTDYSSRDEELNGIIPVLGSEDGRWVQ